MTEISQTKAVECLWDRLENKKYGMLGICGEPNAKSKHMQPMTAQAERETDTIWFFTYKDSNLAEDIAAGDSVMGMFCMDSGDNQFYGCMSGRMTLEHDVTRIEKFWNPMLSAWYPEGKTDPRLTMIRFDLQEAQLWIVEKGKIAFATEIVKASLQHHQPDLGAHVSVRF